jgi:hypothetical protein
MIYRTRGRTIMFSQVGFLTIRALISAPRFSAIRATGLDLGHGISSAPSAAICTISRDLRGDSQENETE